jgi:hypothetical protein
MRQHKLGSEIPKGSWRPRPSCKARVPKTEKTSTDSGPVMSLLPTWRGDFRIIPLKHFFHADMGYMLEADPDTVKWTTDVQPVPYVEDGEQRVFVPSMMVETRSGVRLIKLVHGSAPNSRRPRTVKVAPRPQPGMTFEIYSRRDLLHHPRLQASRDIIYRRCWELDPHLPMRLAAMTAGKPLADLGELHNLMGATPDHWDQLLALVAKGYVVVDMSAPLGPKMPVRECRSKGYRDA